MVEPGPGRLTLIGILARDRPEGLRACLEGLRHAGAPARVVIHLDAAEPEVTAIARASGYTVLSTEHQVGIGAALNRLLAEREPGQDFCRIDGDTELITEGWLAKLLEHLPARATVSTVLRTWDGAWARGLEPGPGLTNLRMGRGVGSVMCIAASALETLGGFREGLPFAFEDGDWYDRLRRAKLRAGIDTRVVAREAAPPNRKLWRLKGERVDPVFATDRAAFVRERRPIHRPIPAPKEPEIIPPAVGTDLSQPSPLELTEAERAVALSISHSTHLEALAWAAATCGPGAVLEIGSGCYSTPWLHGWCEGAGRWLLTIETEPEWAAWTAELYGTARHAIQALPRGLVELPAETWALVLVDGISEDRAAWIRELSSSRAKVVVHDTEPTRLAEFPGEAEALATFESRRDFDRIFPYTSVVWNAFAPPAAATGVLVGEAGAELVVPIGAP